MSFSAEVGHFALDFINGSETAVRGTTIKLWEAIILSSPVDTGRFRGNWFASMNGVNATTTNTDSGTRTSEEAAQAVLSQIDYSKFTLTNNLPYAEVIELGLYQGQGPNTISGYSTQAPRGVVRINVMRFSRILNAEARRHLPR